MKNLKMIGVMLVAMLVTFTIQAQDEEKDRRDRLEFGVKAGANISNVWDARDDEFTADPKLGLAGGLFIGIPIGTIFGLQPELLISQKGFKGSGSFLATPYSFKRTTTFIDVPLQIQIKPTQFLSFLLGPQFSYLVKQKDDYSFGANSTFLEEEFENDNIRKNILGFVAGADIIYKSLVISGRVGWDFQNNNGDGSSITPRYKNQWLQFTLGFKI